jgi:glycosyltransferase involved in cell wall biosynthesis
LRLVDPLVSVIIPTLDRPEYLAAAVNSVLRQRAQDFEVLVVDDGSTADLRPVLEALDDGRIRYFRHESNRGEAAARNTGIVNARGAYLAFLDDDDEWLPDKLRLQLELFSRCPDTVGCVYGGHEAFRARDGQVVSRQIPTKRGDLSRELLQANVLGPPSTVVLTRACLDRVGPFDEAIGFGVDYDLWIRVAQIYHFDFVPDIVTRYTVHRGQMSSDPFVIAKGHADLLRKYASRLRWGRRRKGMIHYAIGRQLCLHGNAAEARKAFLKALRFDPLQVRAYVYLVVSLGGPTSASKLWTLLRKVRGIHPADH